MSTEPDDREEAWDGSLCSDCGAEDSLIDGWDEDGRLTVVCGECGSAFFPEPE